MRKNELLKLRKKIDLNDQKILKLLDLRAHLVQQVGRWKKSHNYQVYDPSRETQVLHQLCKAPHPHMTDSEVHQLFYKLIDFFRSHEQAHTLIESATLPKKMKIGFLGFGLIGASVGLALKQQFPKWKYLVHDPFLQNSTEFKTWNKKRFQLVELSELKSLDVIFLGAPVKINQAQAPLLVKNNRIVLDLGSVLKPIAGVYGFHPLAGKEKSKFSQAQADLFYNKIICLTETESEKISSENLLIIKSLVHALGAKEWIGTTQNHNHKLAYSSHMVHLLAMALGQVLMDNDFANDQELIPKSCHDFLRITGCDHPMWESIITENHGSIQEALKMIQVKLDQIKNQLTIPSQINKVLNESRITYEKLYLNLKGESK